MPLRIPGLDSLVKNYKDQAVTFLAISYEPPTFICDKFISQDKFTYDHLTFPKDTVIHKYFGYGYPLNIVLDRFGTIKYFNYGGQAKPIAADLVYNDLKTIIDKLNE